MRKPKLRELKEAIKVLIQGPYTSKFPKEPSVPPERYRGKPEYDDEECVGCGACAEVCPAGAIDVIDTDTRELVLHCDNCIFCGQCEASCTTEEGIELTGEYDLATLDRTEAEVRTQKFELIRCEVCGEVISTVDHIRWLAKKLGPQAFSNPTLILTSYKELALVEEVAPRPSAPPVKRSDQMRILCPKCRREVFLTEEGLPTEEE